MRFTRTIAICVALAAGGAASPGQEPAAPAPTAAGRFEAGIAAQQKGDHTAARAALEEAKTLSEAGPAESRIRYEVLKALSTVQSSMGDYEQAEQSLERAMNWRERYERAALVDLAGDRLEMAAVLEWRKEYARAAAVLSSIEQEYLRESHNVVDPRLGDVLSRQAQVFSAMGEKSAAAYISERAVRVRSAQLGEWHPWLTTELERLGMYSLQAREYAKAEEAYRRALLIRERTQGRDHIDLVSALDGLAYALFGQKKHAEAEQVYSRLLNSWVQATGVEHPMAILTLDKMASLYRDWGREPDAVAAESKAIALRALFHANGLAKQAGELVRQKRVSDALAIYKRALALLDESRTEHAELRKKLSGLTAELTPHKAPQRAKAASPAKRGVSKPAGKS